MALCEPAATERKSKNTHGLSRMQRSLFTDPFSDFFFWFIFWFWLYLDRTRGIVDGFCKCAALAFLRTIYVCKIIAYHTTIWITAAASGNACKSVLNPFATKKNKGQKKSVSKTPCASVRSVSFFLTFVLQPKAHRTNYGMTYLYSYSKYM